MKEYIINSFVTLIEIDTGKYILGNGLKSIPLETEELKTLQNALNQLFPLPHSKKYYEGIVEKKYNISDLNAIEISNWKK